VEHSISGVWFLFDRLQVKLKTGRPANVRKEKKEKQAVTGVDKRPGALGSVVG